MTDEFDELLDLEAGEAGGSSKQTVLGKSEDDTSLDDDFSKTTEDQDSDDDLDGPIDNSDDDPTKTEADELQGMHDIVNTLVTQGKLQLFVNDEGELEKPLSEYTNEELIELISENIDNAIQMAAETAPVELFKKFPEKVQTVINHTLKGATDEQLKSLFSNLANMQEMADLDPSKKADAIRILREYHTHEGIHTPEEIEDLITSAEDSKTTEKLATKYKTVLQSKADQVLQQKLAKQEEIDKTRKARLIQKSNLAKAVLTGSLKEMDQNFRVGLFNGLTNSNYQNEKGEQVNELNHLIEKYENGTEAEMETLLTAYSILKDKNLFFDEYEKKLRAKIHAEIKAELESSNSGGGGSQSRQTSHRPANNKPAGGIKRKTVLSR